MPESLRIYIDKLLVMRCKVLAENFHLSSKQNYNNTCLRDKFNLFDSQDEPGKLVCYVIRYVH